MTASGDQLRPNRPLGNKAFALALFAVAALQSAALGWMINDRVSLLNSGRQIVLNTVPVDPRSLFRGDYVILNYAISTFKPQSLGGDDDFKRGMPVFVTLRKSYRARWQPVAVTSAYPAETPKDQVVIRAIVRSAGKTLRVNYGIESYFVPEGEGKKLEQLVRQSELQVMVAIGTNGEAAIKGLIVDGKVQYEEPLF
ncbi:MAG: GDYXXLXY domain-containing protein [Hyphomicrobiales bacterium]|nr:GDYXXLXY domain-containing protein [Hyphomicrobiales bacterium]